ncbi:MAG: GntR family transcriptional regulator [Chloroflexi bacterium]|nr:GntR family transcriptional regulator [Chloroflexota bacterium]
MKEAIAAPVRTFRPLSEEAYDVLRAAILGGRLQPWARIVEADIARQMATSRSPIREAVRKLEHEGLVEYVPRRGTFVVGLSWADVADAYQLRAHLEAYGARLAATRATEEHLARLLEMLERMRAAAAADDLDWLVTADVEFHRSVCEASGSRRLLQAWETLNPARWTLVSGLRATDLSLEQIAERHWPILAALQSRKPDTAETIIRGHILELGERVLLGLADHVTPVTIKRGTAVG